MSVWQLAHVGVEQYTSVKYAMLEEVLVPLIRTLLFPVRTSFYLEQEFDERLTDRQADCLAILYECMRSNTPL